MDMHKERIQKEEEVAFLLYLMIPMFIFGFLFARHMAKQTPREAVDEFIEQQVEPNEHPVVEGKELELRLNAYVEKCYPPGSTTYRLNEPNIKRKVSKATRQKIIERDGGCCVICYSKEKLEVDHMRALMNGGGNEESNLATLCHVCNSSRMKKHDNSIRKQRDKLRQQ